MHQQWRGQMSATEDAKTNETGEQLYHPPGPVTDQQLHLIVHESYTDLARRVHDLGGRDDAVQTALELMVARCLRPTVADQGAKVGDALVDFMAARIKGLLKVVPGAPFNPKRPPVE